MKRIPTRQAPCCGRTRERSSEAAATEPAAGVGVVYLGARAVRLRGANGDVYEFGPLRRRGVLPAGDLAAALARRDFMLEPVKGAGR